MRLESKWKDHLRGKYPTYLTSARNYKDEYDNDDTVGMSAHESPLKKVIIAGAIVASGVAAYKSGLLKSGIKTMLEYASEYKAYAPNTAKTFKNWLIRNDEIPVNSVVRNKLSKEFIGNFINDRKFQDKVVEDTRADFELLKKDFSHNLSKAKLTAKDITKRDYADADLMYQLGQMHDTVDGLTDKAKIHKNLVKEKITEDVLKTNVFDPKVRARQLKESGYTPVALGEILHKVEDGKGGYKLMNNHPDIHLDNKTMERINEFVATKIKVDGKDTTILESNKFKDIVFDKNIMIGENKKVIDLRNANHSAKEFVESMANDFQIPGLHVNALRLVGLDHFAERKESYVLLHGTTMQPFLTGKMGRASELKNTFGSAPLVGVNGDVFKFSEDFSSLEHVASNMSFREIPKNKKSAFGLPRDINSLRKMAGLNFKDFEAYTEADGWKKNTYGKISSFLDIGSQDTDIRHEVFNPLDKESYIAAIRDKMFVKLPANKNIIGEKKNIGNVFGSAPNGQKVFVAFNDTKSFKSVFDKNSNVTTKDFFQQFIAGRGKDGSGLKNVTKVTSFPYFILERLNDSMATVGLGFNGKNMGSAGDILKNLLLKRFLPVWGIYQAFQYINYSTEHKDKDGNKTDIQKDAAKGVVNLDLGWHHAKDKLGITPIAKKLKAMTPGFDQITEVPGLGFLDMSKTEEEEADKWKNGEVAVRKGRYWKLGNTAYTGGKTMYFIPNWYRRVQSDYKFTDSQYGSRSEYFKNAPFPTLQHPLAPLRYFIFDKYHYEKKHYYDRPYLQASPMFENVPIVGPILSHTLGAIIKPPIKMHPEYWVNSGATPNLQGSQLNAIAPKVNNSKDMYILPTSNVGSLPMDSDSTPKIHKTMQVYETSSGNTQVIKVNDDKPLKYVNHELHNYSIKKVLDVQQRVSSVAEVGSDGEVVNVENPGSASVVAGQQFNNFAKISGIYGLAVTNFVSGDPLQSKTVLDTSGYMNSMSRAFFDQDTGGEGGKMTSLFRRFLNKRKHDMTYYNPIRNTMPTWMPGSGYFVDYAHGDPYTKLERGEARLPGEGYEKLHGISDPMQMQIGSSFIGKSKSDIVKHLLNQDTIIDDFSLKNVKDGNALHKRIESKWLADGLAIDTEGKIDDRKNNIIGAYDAIIHDSTAKNGQAVIDIKSTNGKRFKTIKGIQDDHLKQVNYYLYATHNTNGYVHYVNRDNPNQTKTYKFKFDKKLLKETFDDVNDARRFIANEVDSGRMGRGELYDVLDRYRILADTAPYSQEFQDVSATVSRMDLNENQKAQVSEIRKRMQTVKEPLRLYPYKFKTAKVQYADVTVTKVLDSDTFMTKEFAENPIRLAGVHVSNDKNDKDAKIAQQFVRKYIHKGAKIRIAVNADPNELVANDTLKTVHAVVHAHGKNLNKYLIDNKLGTEKENDNSATGIRARFNSGQIAFGSVWERITHFDTPINTKYMQVRSGLESYKRREIYGKNYQSWSHPFKDFLIPSFESAMNRPLGLVVGAGIGMTFGRGKYGKTIGALVGITAVGAGKIYKHAYELKNGSKWIPKRREKERTINEYVDVLKYVKNMKLYEEYSHAALVNDNIDVKNIINHEKGNGDHRKQRIKELEELKRVIKLHEEDIKMARKMAVQHHLKYATSKMTIEELEHAVNEELRELMVYRKVFNTSEDATKAIFYHNEAKQTMYGYESGDPIGNILKALPKKERDYMKYFMDAPTQERGKILEVAPRYLRRPLEAAWGLPVEKKPNLIEYFKHHQLPGPKWVGWDEDVDMNAVKVKIVRHEAQDMAEYNIWDDQVNQANAMGKMPLPKINFRDNAMTVRSKLVDLMHGSGLSDIRVDMSYTQTDADVSLDLKEDKRKEIEDHLKRKSIL